MGLRFRRRLQIFPGLYLNFSGSGVSVTLGVPGANVNLSKRGIEGTAGLPGTGLHYRTNLVSFGGSSGSRNSSQPSRELPVEAFSFSSTDNEIRSSDGDISSSNLRQLKDLVTVAREQAEDAAENRAELVAELKLTELRKRRFRLFSLGFLFKEKLARLESHSANLKADIETTAELEKLSVVPLSMKGAEQIESVWRDFLTSFEDLAGSEKIWDLTASAALLEADRVRRRTSASSELDRKPVTFQMGTSPAFNTETKIPIMQNQNGSDLLFHPGFLYMALRGRDFSLVDFHELEIRMAPVRFIEDEGVPSDSEVIDSTWLRVNKDGSPDRRFKENRKIPVCLYGELMIRSKTGVNEKFLVSNYRSLERFIANFDELKQAARTLIHFDPTDG